MASTTIDRVEIKITATASEANKVLDNLKKKMSALQGTMGNVNVSGLTNLTNALNRVATSVDNLSAKMKNLKNINVTPNINTSEMSKSEKNVSNNVDKIKENLEGLKAYGNAAMNGDSSALTSFERRATSIQSAIDMAQQSLKNLGDTRVQTDDFVKLQSQIDGASEKLKNLETIRNNVNSGRTTMSSGEFVQLKADIQSAAQELSVLKAKQNEALRTGSAYTDPMQKYRDSLAMSQSQLDSFVSQVHSKVGSLDNVQPKVSTRYSQEELEKLMSRAEKTKSALLNLASGAKSAFSKVGSAISSIPSKVAELGKNITGLNSKFAKGFGTILKYGLGIRSLYVLFRRLRTAITDSFTQLQSSGAFFETTAANVDSLKTALLTLKYQFGAAFEPIFNYIAPALQTFINYLIAAMNVLSAFVAKITGNSTYSKVKSVTAEVAKNTSSAADSAKELNKQLQGFDELNNMTSNSGSSGSGGSGSGSESAIYETANVSDTLSGLDEKLGKIWDVFKSAWDEKGKDVIESATSLLKTLKDLVTKVGNTFYRVFTEGYGYKWLTSVLEVVRSILDNINEIASAFSEAWDSKGYDTVASIFGMLTSINQTIATVTDSWSKAWSNHGTEIFENILQTITNINNTIKNISDNFRTAWEEAGVGDSICDGILTIVEDISGFIEDITSATEEWSASLDFYPLLESVDTTIQSIRKFMKQIEDIASSLYKNYILPIVKKITESTIPTILKEVSGILDTITSALSGVNWDELFTTLEQITELGIDTLLSSAKDSLVKIKDALTFIGIELKAIQTFWNWFKGTPVYKTLKDIYDVVNSMSEKKNVFEVMFPDISKIVNRISSITNTLKTLWSWKDKSWSEIGKEIVNGFVNGIKEKLEKNVLVNLFKSVITWVKDLFGVHSPSTVFKAIGEDLIDGLKNGLKAKVDQIKSWIKKNVTDKIKGFFDGVKTITISIAGKVLDSFTKAKESWEAIESKVETLTAEAKEKVKGALQTLKDNWSKGWETTKKLWTSALEKPGETIEKIKTTWKSWTDTTKQLWTTAQEKTDGLIKTIQDKWKTWRNTDDTKTLKANATDEGTIAKTQQNWNNATFSAKSLSVSWDPNSATTLSAWNNVKDNKNPGVTKAIKLVEGTSKSGSFSAEKTKWDSIADGVSATKTVKVSADSTLNDAYNKWKYFNDNKISELKVTFNNSFTSSLTTAWNGMVTRLENALNSLIKKGKITTEEIPGRLASGGSYYGGSWHNIPQYANGTTNAHGSVFIAGEAGPEVVGHINGRTEVLNRSQLASTIFTSITNGMRQFKGAQMVQPPQLAYANGAIATYSSNQMNNDNSNELIAEQNRLIAEQNRLLGIIADKDVTISSRDVFNATRSESNNYFNRTGNSPFLF